MPYSYTVQERRDGRSMSFASSGDRMTITWQIQFDVIVSATGGDAIEDVSAYDVITASGLPQVNQSIYYSSTTNEVLPLVICRNKTAKVNDRAMGVWRVTASYKSFDSSPQESANQPVTPPALLTDFSPVEQPFLRETEKVIYEDYTPTPQRIQLPSGAFFAEPVMERVPIFGLKITQYESALTYQNMIDRKFRFNNATYRTKAASSWIIEDIERSEVVVQLSGGSTTAVLATYTLLHNPLPEGWKRSLALVDYKHKVGSDFVPHLEGDPLTASLVLVDSTGVKKGDQTQPDYVEFLQQQSVDYSSFLQA